MRSIVRRNTDESYEEFLTALARALGTSCQKIPTYTRGYYAAFSACLATVTQTAGVSAHTCTISPGSMTPTTLVSRREISRTPGSSRTNSLAMITDFTPRAYMVHDLLHVRGGHQVSWLIDGTFIPNTNIAANVGPVIDPFDIAYLEIERSSY